MNMFVGAGFYARLPKAHASYVRGDVGIAPYGMTTDSRA